MEPAQQKEVFSRYVAEITQSQRDVVVQKIEKLTVFQSRSWYYLLGCVTVSTASVIAVFRFWGPRHIFKNSMYYVRPLPPAISMGIVAYGILFTCRGMLMRSRIWTLMEDYEYELKRIKAHHCKEGVAQLAWLQFVMEQLKQGTEYRFDLEKLRRPPVETITSSPSPALVAEVSRLR